MNEQFDQILGYLDGMWRYRGWALLLAWFVALVGWSVVNTLPDRYEASTIINVDTYSIMDPLLEGITVDLNPGDELAAVTQTLFSRANLESIIREVGLESELDNRVAIESAIIRLRRSIRIEDSGRARSDPNTRIYGIRYEDTSPAKAYQVVSRLLEMLIEGSAISDRTDVTAAQDFLDAQIADYEERLLQAEQNLADFKKQNVGLMPDEKGSYYDRIQKGLDEIEQTRTEIRLATQRQAELRKQLSGETPLISSSDFDNPNSLSSRLRTYETELAELLTRFTEQHPDVIELRARIAELRNGIDSGRSSLQPDTRTQSGNAELNPVYQELKIELSKASVELESLRIQLAEQQRKVTELKRYLDAIPEVEAQLSRLNRDYEVTKNRYIDLVERRESAQLSGEVGQSSSEITFRVIEPPVEPIFPSGPDRFRLLTTVLFAALGMGGALALAFYMLRPTYSDPRALKSATGFPVLGTVSLNLPAAARIKKRFQSFAFALALLLLFGAYGGSLMYGKSAAGALRTLIAANGLS